MFKTAIFALFGLAVIAFVVIVAGLALLAWIAKGSRDVNGDPERDAGGPTGPIDLHPTNHSNPYH